MTRSSKSAILEPSPAALAASADLLAFVGDKKFEPFWPIRHGSSRTAPARSHRSISGLQGTARFILTTSRPSPL